MAREVHPRVPDAQAADPADKVITGDAPSDAEVLIRNLRVAGCHLCGDNVKVEQ